MRMLLPLLWLMLCGYLSVGSPPPPSPSPPSLLDEQGYDSMASLEGLTREEAGEIADAVKMKPGHKKRFIDGVV